MEAEELEFAKGDLNGVMSRFDHVREWVEDFESRHGTRPMDAILTIGAVDGSIQDRKGREEDGRAAHQ